MRVLLGFLPCAVLPPLSRAFFTLSTGEGSPGVADVDRPLATFASADAKHQDDCASRRILLAEPARRKRLAAASWRLCRLGPAAAGPCCAQDDGGLGHALRASVEHDASVSLVGDAP